MIYEVTCWNEMENKNSVLECKDIERVWEFKASRERNDKL